MNAYYDPKKIRRLVVFGDSWTAGHGIESDIRYREIPNPEPFIERFRNQNAWSRWLAEKMGLPYVNMGKPGICNVVIKRKIQENIKFCDPETDLIIVMLTYPYRHHQHMDLLNENEISLGDIMSTIQKLLAGYNVFYCNAFYPIFRNEPELTLQMDMTRFILPNMSASDVLVQYETSANVSVWEYGKRHVNEDINAFQEGEYHPNLLGHKIIADWLFNTLLDYSRVGPTISFQ